MTTKVSSSIVDTANITSVGTLTSLSVTGNIISGNANLGNLAIANFFSGSGNLLSNIQVANVTGLGNIATINKDGNASNILYGNGVFASAPVTYSDSNVATYLPTYTGNLSPGNLAVSGTANLGNISNVKITGGASTQVLTTDGTGNVSFTHNVHPFIFLGI